MSVGFITHDESMITMFMEEPEYADHLMSEIIADGDKKEIERFQTWYDEAKKRRNASALDVDFWGKLAENVKIAVQNGQIIS